MGVIKGSKGSNKLLNLANCSFKSSNNFQLIFNSLNLLGQNFLLVLRNGDAHGVIVAVDGVEKATDGIISLIVNVLSLLKISICSIKIEDLLDLLDLIFSCVKLTINTLTVFSITNEGILGFCEKLKSVLGLLLCVFPTILNSLDIGLKELGFVRVLEDDLTLGNEICDNVSLGIQLGKRFLLSLNKLINILKARWSNISGGGQHNSIKEFNMGLKLITISIALPVKINHDSSLLDIRDEFLMFLDQSVKLSKFSGPLVLGTLSHEDFQNLLEPFPHFSSLKIFTERIECVSFSLELRRCVDFISHNSGNGFLNIFHPFSHLQMPHLIHLLDEGIVLLPERHLGTLSNPDPVF